MQRLAVLALLVLAAVVGVPWLKYALSSDEERIRAMLERMADGIDDSSPGDVLSGFDAERYIDETSRYGVAELQSALLYLFLQERLDLEAEFDQVDGIEITLHSGAEPGRATVRFHCRLEERLSDGSSRLWWDLRGLGEVEEREGRWRFVSSSEVEHGTRRR